MEINYYKQYEPIFGAWKITRLIGEGSFGKVFEMEREDFGVTYKAALKAITVPANENEVREVMAEGMDEASVRDYFGTFVQDLVKEFALMSKLKGNSNVVSYENHQVIPHKGGIGWDILIQMELLTPLNEYIRKHTVTRQDVIRLGIDLCKALELCQKYNIIHRDVKPENIFISDAGDYKLGDFGIARTVEKTTSGLSKKGTYTYMAPEVYKGEAYGSTVDIYSLGIVLYRLLNGNRTPFLPAAPAPITHADRENALVKRLSGAVLPPPSHAEGRLSEIVLKACAYDPKERYSSPMQMRHELEAILYSREEGKYIYPEGDDVPQDSVHYVKTGEEKLGAGYEKTQRDGEGTARGFDGGGTASDFDRSRTASDFGGSRTTSDFDGSRTTSDFGGSRSGGRFDGTRTVSDFGGRERTGGETVGGVGRADGNEGGGTSGQRASNSFPPKKKPVGVMVAAALMICVCFLAGIGVLVSRTAGTEDEDRRQMEEAVRQQEEVQPQPDSSSGDETEDRIETAMQEDESEETEMVPASETGPIRIGVMADTEAARLPFEYLLEQNPTVTVDGVERPLEIIYSPEYEGIEEADYDRSHELSGQFGEESAKVFNDAGCVLICDITYEAEMDATRRLQEDVTVPVIAYSPYHGNDAYKIDTSFKAEYSTLYTAEKFMLNFAAEELQARHILSFGDPQIAEYLNGGGYEGTGVLCTTLEETSDWDTAEGVKADLLTLGDLSQFDVIAIRNGITNDVDGEELGVALLELGASVPVVTNDIYVAYDLFELGYSSIYLVMDEVESSGELSPFYTGYLSWLEENPAQAALRTQAFERLAFRLDEPISYEYYSHEEFMIAIQAIGMGKDIDEALQQGTFSGLTGTFRFQNIGDSIGEGWVSCYSSFPILDMKTDTVIQYTKDGMETAGLE